MAEPSDAENPPDPRRARDGAEGERTFEKADRLREKLRASGVEVYDREHVFQTKSGRRGVFGGAASGGGSGGGGGGGGSGGGQGGQQQIDDATLQGMLLERERARSVKDFRDGGPPPRETCVAWAWRSTTATASGP